MAFCLSSPARSNYARCRGRRRGPRTCVKRALLLVPLLAFAACGGAAGDREPGEGTRPDVDGLGIAVDLPPDWNARILIGAEGRAVLHAANFPLPSNDADTGEVAQQMIGSSGQMYVNVH